MLQSMGSGRAGHDWTAEQQQSSLLPQHLFIYSVNISWAPITCQTILFAKRSTVKPDYNPIFLEGRQKLKLEIMSYNKDMCPILSMSLELTAHMLVKLFKL